MSGFVMRGVFQTVPKDLVDSAKIDGAGAFRTLVSIMLPLVRNGIVVVIIINFVIAWGEYLLASRLMNEQSEWTMPVVLAPGQTQTNGAQPPTAGGSGLTPEETADYILTDYDAIWSAWVPEDVAERVRAGL